MGSLLARFTQVEIQRVSEDLVAARVWKIKISRAIYKLPQLTREKIEAMFGLQELKQTRYFQDVAADYQEKGRIEGKLEGKLESVPGLLALGLTVEQIAGVFGLDVQIVQQAADGEFFSETSPGEDTES